MLQGGRRTSAVGMKERAVGRLPRLHGTSATTAARSCLERALSLALLPFLYVLEPLPLRA